MTVWQKLCSWRLRGNWQPGGYNVILLISQVTLLWMGAQRGMDYVTTTAGATQGEIPATALRGIEADISLTLLGLAFLIPAGVAFVGLATGWAKALSLGHLFVGAAYLVLGITFLRDSPVDSWLTALLGCSLLVVAAYLLVADSRQIPDVLAFFFGVVFMVVGGWLAAQGLGSGYRTGNSFVGVAVLHFVMGFGTQIMARREERLRREEEEDFQELRRRG